MPTLPGTSKASKPLAVPCSTSLPSQLLHLSTLQLVTRSAPFTHSLSTPLHTLSHLLGEYLMLLARAAKENAELAGRTEPGVWDVGRALDEFGSARVDELREEFERGRGGGGLEGRQIRELAQVLQESKGPTTSVEPWGTLEFAPLSNEEINHLNEPVSPGAAEQLSDNSDGDEEEEEGSSPATSLEGMEGVVVTKQEDDDESLDGWKSPSLRPAHVPAFLPPFPGQEKVPTLGLEPGRRKKERERDEDAWTGSAFTATLDPWLDLVPYGLSTLAASVPTPLPPPGRRRSLSPPAAASSSLTAFRQELPNILALVPSYPPRNPKRRHIAQVLADQALTGAKGDTLFGAIPLPATRSAALLAGFYPDDIAFMPLHPFSTNLPWTISRPVPAHPAPSGTLLAPALHARLPTVVSAVRNQLSRPPLSPGAVQLQLFSRLLRSGPPGPVSSTGKAGPYTYLGQTGLVDAPVEWKRRYHNERLSRDILEAAAGGGEEEDKAGSGIKLNLKLGRGGGANSAGATPVAEEAPSRLASPTIMAPLHEEEEEELPPPSTVGESMFAGWNAVASGSATNNVTYDPLSFATYDPLSFPSIASDATATFDPLVFPDFDFLSTASLDSNSTLLFPTEAGSQSVNLDGIPEFDNVAFEQTLAFLQNQSQELVQEQQLEGASAVDVDMSFFVPDPVTVKEEEEEEEEEQRVQVLQEAAKVVDQSTADEVPDVQSTLEQEITGVVRSEQAATYDMV